MEVSQTQLHSDEEKVQRSHRLATINNPTVIMWKPVTEIPYTNLEASEHGVVRDADTKTNVHQHKDINGYPCISVYGKEYKIHRIVANHYVKRLEPGLEVHHLDFNKGNPYYKNLVVCTRAEHRRYHASTFNRVESKPAKHGDIVLTEQGVHNICRLVKSGYSYPRIRQDLGLFNITDNCINKIVVGKNWRNISKQYELKPIERRHMNLYSDKQRDIAILMNCGYDFRTIAESLGFDVSNKTEYNNFYKCAKRYYKKYLRFEYGLVRNDYVNKLVKELGL